jgi:hypothetical protein
MSMTKVLEKMAGALKAVTGRRRKGHQLPGWTARRG